MVGEVVVGAPTEAADEALVLHDVVALARLLSELSEAVDEQARDQVEENAAHPHEEGQVDEYAHEEVGHLDR